jgi:DNA-binding FrmR family transcriptional regulator
MNDQEHIQNKQKAALAIKKARGIIDKVLDMTESGVYCPEVIQQIDAISGLLNSAKKTLLKGHMSHCLEINMKQDKQKAIDELLKIFDLK